MTPDWYWRLIYRLTGACKRYRPGTNGICRICEWER